MSGVLAGKVWESGLLPRLKPLAAAIADIVDRDGNGLFASIEYLSWLTGLGERAVQAQMGELRAAALLVATCHPACNEHPGVGHGRGQPVRYRLCTEQLPEREAWEAVRARRKGARSAPFTDHERVHEEPQKGDPDIPKGRSWLHPIRSGDPEEEPITERSIALPLSKDQEQLAKYLRREVVNQIYGARTGAPRAVDYGEDEVRSGVTRSDIDDAIRATLDQGKYGHNGAAYVLGCLRGRLEDRKEGRGDANSRGSGGETGRAGAARASDARGVRAGSRGRAAPTGVDPRYDYSKPVPKPLQWPEDSG